MQVQRGPQGSINKQPPLAAQPPRSGPAHLSNSSHFPAFHSLLDMIPTYSSLIAPPLEDLCIFTVPCWSTLLPLYSARCFLLFRHQLMEPSWIF